MMNLLFPPTSRYFSVATMALEEGDGRVIVYLQRRFARASRCCRSMW